MIDALRDPTTAHLTRPIAFDRLDRPANVGQTPSGDLVFGWNGARRYVSVPSDLLEQFLKATSDESLLRFACRWGWLRVAAEEDGKAWTIELERIRARWDHATRTAVSIEPIAGWRYFQKIFSAVLNLAVALRDDSRLQPSLFFPLNWPDFFDLTPASLRDWQKWTPSQQQNLAGRTLSFWTARLVDTCGLRPMLVFNQQAAARFDVVFTDALSADGSTECGISLFGALTSQLLTTVAGTGFAVCSNCGTMYVPKRRPAPTRRRYCETCRGAKVPKRDAKRAFRARQFAARRQSTPKPQRTKSGKSKRRSAVTSNR